MGNGMSTSVSFEKIDKMRQSSVGEHGIRSTPSEEMNKSYLTSKENSRNTTERLFTDFSGLKSILNKNMIHSTVYPISNKQE